MSKQARQLYKPMRPQKVNLILIVLIDIAVIVLFFTYFNLRGSLTIESRRIDELEKRPLVASEFQHLPEAGESGKILVTPFPTASTIATPSTSSPSASPKITATPDATIKRVTYIPLFGGGTQTTDTNWVDVAGSEFQLKASDYGTNSYFNWEAIAWVIGGSGQVKLRIYDTTNNVVVGGSEISGSAPARALISSGRLTFFSGNNTYRVQISSQTSSPAQFDFGRIKVVY